MKKMIKSAMYASIYLVLMNLILGSIFNYSVLATNICELLGIWYFVTWYYIMER